MLNKFLNKLPLAIVLGIFVFLLNVFVLNVSAIGKPVLQYSEFIPSIFFRSSSYLLDALSWIFLINILLISLNRVNNVKKELKTSRQKILHGLTIGTNCGFIANTFLFHNSDLVIYFALGFIGLMSLIILFQDGLLAGISTTITSSLVFLALYLSLVLSAVVGTIIVLVLLPLAYGVVKISNT